jgi:Na+/H+ antiporter NhaC
MTGSVRYVLAAAFVLLWWLMPDADHGRLAALQVEDWLADEVLPAFTRVETAERPGPVDPGAEAVVSARKHVPTLAPRIAVDESRTHAEDRNALEKELRALLERSPRTYTRQEDDRVLDETMPPIALEILVGKKGFQATASGLVGDEPTQMQLVRVEGDVRTGYYPDRNSLVPAFAAIVLAILFGRVIPALLLGSLAGAILSVASVTGGATRLVTDTIAQDVLYETFNLEVIAFVVLLFMAIGVMTRSGGVQGLAEALRRLARGPVSTQLVTYAIGLAIFFDDYANCVLTGTTMRPIADRNRVSREKLAYIVDSTAAPIAGISIFSTWVAYEISTFAPQLPEVTREDGTPFQQSEGFAVFVSTLPFRFYCIFTLAMVLLTIVLRRDFGPMGRAQRRAAIEGKILDDDAKPMISTGFDRLAPTDGGTSLWNALAPLLLLVTATIGGILWIGLANSDPLALEGDLGQTLRTILNNTQSQRALWIASALALLLASILAVVNALVPPAQCILAALRSAKSLGFAIIILVLAWTIGQTCQDLGTAQYLTAAFQGRFPPWLLPGVMFLLASLVSFSTGTSYGTMAILLPNVVVLAHATGEAAPELTGPAMMVLTIGAVLEGSIFGDHCSPISDTTVLSSVSTGSDHLHHVRTQAPYALTVMAVALLCGYMPMAWFGTEGWIWSWVAGLAALVVMVRFVGTTVDHGDRRSPTTVT